MTWQPGLPVVTATDVAEWQAWKKASILDAQRKRRQQYRRIDYYPSDEACEAIQRALDADPRRTYAAIIDAALSATLPD